AHGRIERHLESTPIPSVVLHANYFMTNLLMMADPVRHTGTLFSPAGDARIAMIDPRDVAAAAAIALSADGDPRGIWTLSGPADITFADVAQHLSEATGAPIGFVDVPEDRARQGMIASGMPEWLPGRLLILFQMLERGAGSRVTDEVRTRTGRAPRSFAAFARDHASMFRRASSSATSPTAG